MSGIQRHVDFGQRSAFVKSKADFEKLRLANRRLAIEIEEDADFQKMLIQLSRYGRVLHIDWPIEASMNPTL